MPQTYHPFRITAFRRAVCAGTELPRRDGTRLPIRKATQSRRKRTSGVTEGHGGRYWESCTRGGYVLDVAYGAGVGRSGRSDVASDPRTWTLGDSKKFEGVAHKG